MPPRARRLNQRTNNPTKTMMNPINAARATLQVAGLPNEDVAEIAYEPLEAAGVSITGRAFNAWDRDAVLERVVSASGNGDVSVADAAGGELHELPLAAVGLSTVQVGCTAGAVSVAAFDATPAAAAKPVVLAAVASMLADALREVGLNEVEPVIFLRVPASSNAAAAAVCDAAASFGLVEIDRADSGVIALTRSEATATLDAAFKFEPASPKVPGAGLDIVAVPRIVVPPTYAEAAAGVTAVPSKPAPALPVYRSLRFLAIFVVACMLIGMWTFAYPADAGASQSATTTTTTTTSTAKTPLLELLRHPAARGRTLQSVGGSGSEFDGNGAPDGTYMVDLASMTKILHEIVQDRRGSGSASGSASASASGRDDDDYTVGWTAWFWTTHSISS